MCAVIRQCVICRHHFARDALHRFALVCGVGVVHVNDNAIPKAWRGLLRRSVYLCHDTKCTGSKGLLQRLQRSLKHPITPDVLHFLTGKALAT
jgi:predicted RNA-binding protein YlxR (DUF448 family)